MNKMY